MEIEIAKKAKKQGLNRPASIPTCEHQTLEIVKHGSLFRLKYHLPVGDFYSNTYHFVSCKCAVIYVLYACTVCQTDEFAVLEL